MYDYFLSVDHIYTLAGGMNLLTLQVIILAGDGGFDSEGIYPVRITAHEIETYKTIVSHGDIGDGLT